MRNRVKLYKAMSLIVVLALAAMTLAGAGPAIAQSQGTSRVIVQGASLTQAAAAVTANGGQVTAHIDIINAVVADVPQANLTRLSSAPGVKNVTLDRQVNVSCDPGDEGDASGVEFQFPKVIGADKVWKTGDLGDNVTVAFLDSGIDTTFLGLRKGPGLFDLQNRYLAYYDATNKKLYEAPRLFQSPQDPNGHGTHVAGIVGNSGRDDGLYHGIAPKADLVAVRVLDKNGMGSYADVLEGLNWVVQNKAKYNIRVLNISMYATPVAPYWVDPYNLAVMAAWKAGIVVVASAGNDGPNPLSIGVPGNTPYIITVGTFTDNYTPNDFSDDYMPPFSATGPTLDAFVKPDVIAPGAHIGSLMKNNSYLARTYPDNRIGSHYFKMSGTSMSAGMVSGLVALMLSKHPELTPDQVKYRLTMTARPQFSEATGEMAYSIWQQGAGRVWGADAVLSNVQGSANQGMNITADLAGTTHYEGYSELNPTTNQFEIRGDGYASWAGGYASWAGNYASWAGGYASWAGGTGSTNWAGGYASWAGGYASWAGGYASWAGNYASWAGGYASWAGGYASWAGGYASWAGGYPSWAGSVGNPTWASSFAHLKNIPGPTSGVSIDWVP